jgi:hypothetical protein
MFTGVFIPDAVYSYRPLSALAKLIYGRLCKYKGDRGDAYPSMVTVAEELGISERQAFEHLSKLVDEGFIEREPRPGTSTVYHFIWHPAFDAAAEQSEEVVRKPALPPQVGGWCGNPHQGSAETRTGGSAEIRMGNESIEMNQGSESIPPTPLTENSPEEPTPTELDLEDDVVTFTVNAYRRVNRKAKLDNLKARKNERLAERVRRAESDQGREAFRAGLLAYLSRQDDWLLENHWPIECFLKYPDKYASGAPQNVRYAASGNAQPAHRPLGAPTHHHAPAERATGLPGPNPGMPLAALEWNRVVTAGPPVENWTHRDRGLAVEDPDFLAALPKILPLCQQAFESQPDEVEWLNFRYLLRKGKGEVENWYRMANGEFNWLRKKRGQNRKAAGEASVDNLLGMVNERLAELESTELTQPAGHAS